MSDNFIVDPKLFYNAKRNIANVARREDNLLVLADDLLSSFPPDLFMLIKLQISAVVLMLYVLL